MITKNYLNEIFGLSDVEKENNKEFKPLYNYTNLIYGVIIEITSAYDNIPILQTHESLLTKYLISIEKFGDYDIISDVILTRNDLLNTYILNKYHLDNLIKNKVIFNIKNKKVELLKDYIKKFISQYNLVSDIDESKVKFYQKPLLGFSKKDNYTTLVNRFSKVLKINNKNILHSLLSIDYIKGKTITYRDNIFTLFFDDYGINNETDILGGYL